MRGHVTEYGRCLMRDALHEAAGVSIHPNSQWPMGPPVWFVNFNLFRRYAQESPCNGRVWERNLPPAYVFEGFCQIGGVSVD